jgi:hypothetical protein
VDSACLHTIRAVRIRVRIIDPSHPLMSRKRRLNGGGPSDKTGKTETPCHSRYGTIKIPPCSKALSADHRPKFFSSSPAMVASPYNVKLIRYQFWCTICAFRLMKSRQCYLVQKVGNPREKKNVIKGALSIIMKKIFGLPKQFNSLQNY